MTAIQIEILIEDGTELSSTVSEKGDETYAVGNYKITKKQFYETFDRFKNRFNDNRTHGGMLKQTFRIQKDL